MTIPDSSLPLTERQNLARSCPLIRAGAYALLPLVLALHLASSCVQRQGLPPSLLLVTFDSLRADAVFADRRSPPRHAETLERLRGLGYIR